MTHGDTDGGPRKEIRFALVLNGGVSLAVWMGGVTHELNRLRLASEGITAADNDGAVLAAWAAILNATGKSAAVDVIAGTSAGGLNGSLLATAIASGTDMPDMGNQWSTLADLRELANLHRGPDPLDPNAVDLSNGLDGTVAPSLLSGAYFSAKVKDLVETRRELAEQLAPRDCTLLVTATAVHGDPSETSMERGGPTWTVDSRRVYRFEYRAVPPSTTSEVVDDFSDRITLALAARASASFPVAFDQLWESEALRRRRVGDRGPACSRLMDGGVLDNAPFGPLLDTLIARPIDEPFERVLLYVTPGVASVRTGVSAEQPTLKSVLGAVVAATREPDQRLDHDVLGTTFKLMSYSRSQSFEVVKAFLLGTDNSAVESYVEAARHVFDRYRHGRAEALERQFAEGQGSNASPWKPPDPPQLPDDAPGIPTSFDSVDGSWHFGLAPADRILRWWGRAMTAIATSRPIDASETFALINEAQRIVTAYNADLDEILIAPPGQTMSLSTQVGILTGFYDDSAKREALSNAMTSAALAMCVACQGEDDISVTNLIRVSQSIEVLSCLHDWGGADYDTPTFHYENVTPAVKSLATFGRPLEDDEWPSKKLYGERWNHFGAFATEEGRRQDWLWGRLDGASALASHLLTRPLVSEDEAATLKDALRDAILASESVTLDDLRTRSLSTKKMSPVGLLGKIPTPERNQLRSELERNAMSLLLGLGADTPFSAGALLQTTLASKQTWTVRKKDYGFTGWLKKRAIRGYTSVIRRQVNKKIDKVFEAASESSP